MSVVCSTEVCNLGYKFINLTGSTVRLYDSSIVKANSTTSYIEVGYVPAMLDKLASIIIEPDKDLTISDGTVTRVSSKVEPEEGCTCCTTCCTGFTRYDYEYNGKYELPEPVEDTYYIVSPYIQQVYGYRDDFVTTYGPVRCRPYMTTSTTCCSSTSSTIVGYLGLQFPLKKPYDVDKPKDIYVSLHNNISGTAGTMFPLDVSFFTKEEEDVIEVTYTPTNCRCHNASYDVTKIVMSGQSETITGTCKEVNKIVKNISVEIGSVSGKIKLTYDDAYVVIDVPTTKE